MTTIPDHWVAEDIARMAVLNLCQIIDGADTLLTGGAGVDFRRGVLHMTALMCFPTTYMERPGEAIGMVHELRAVVQASKQQQADRS